MTTLESDFEDKLANAVLDDYEAALFGEQGNITHEFVQRVHGRLRRYGERLDYNVDPVIDSFEVVGTERTDRRVTVRLRWTGPMAVFGEYGTPSHEIEGNPILSFVWEERHDPPDWVKRDYEREGDGWRVFLPKVEVAGIEKIRQVRTALRWFRAQGR